MKNKDKKNWFLILVIVGMLYLAWAIFQLIQAVRYSCSTIGTIIKPTIALLCQAGGTFYIPFGLVIGLIAIIVGIYYYANYNKK